MDRRRFLAGTVAVVCSTTAACLGRSNDAAADHDIGMSAQRFLPDTYAVQPGTTVVWRNTGSRAHTVTAYESAIPDEAEFFASGGFDSVAAAREAWREGGDDNGAIYGGETFEHTFTVPGEYGYFCIPHEPGGMLGTIVVTESATRTPR